MKDVILTIFHLLFLQFEAQGKLTFPRIPLINTPLFSSRILGSDDTEDTNVESVDELDFLSDSPSEQLFFPKHHHFGNNFVNLANIIPVPNITALLESRNITNATTVIVQPVAALPSLHKFFHLNPAVYHARKHLANALNTTGDVTLGIQSALQRALTSDDPVGSVNMLIQTILFVYGTAIQKCPILFMCAKLASEAASLVQRVITGIMTATVI